MGAMWCPASTRRRWGAVVVHGGLDEAVEDGVRVVGLGQEFWVELAGDEEGMGGDFHDLCEFSIR